MMIVTIEFLEAFMLGHSKLITCCRFHLLICKEGAVFLFLLGGDSSGGNFILLYVHSEEEAGILKFIILFYDSAETLFDEEYYVV